MQLPYNPPPGECVIQNAQVHSICRCAAHLEIGSVIVNAGGIKISVGLDRNGVRWPPDVAVSKEMAVHLEPMIRREWLRAIAEMWNAQPVKVR